MIKLSICSTEIAKSLKMKENIKIYNSLSRKKEILKVFSFQSKLIQPSFEDPKIVTKSNWSFSYSFLRYISRSIEDVKKRLILKSFKKIKKQKSEKELVKMLKKFCFGGQDDVKRPKWWKILWKNLFQHIWSIVNNLHYSFIR